MTVLESVPLIGTPIGRLSARASLAVTHSVGGVCRFSCSVVSSRRNAAAFATGAGASARKSICITVFSGMIASTRLADLSLPVFFVVVPRFAHWLSPRKPSTTVATMSRLLVPQHPPL